MKTLKFRTLGGRTFTGAVKNPSAKLGTVASRLAARAGLSGTFELVNRRGVTLNPDTELKNLPENEEVIMASELTPA